MLGGLLAMGLTVVGPSAQPRSACEDEQASMSHLWSADAASSLHRVGIDEAGREALDQWMARWRAQRVETCQAREAGAIGASIAFARRQCLDEAAESFGALTRAVREGDLSLQADLEAGSGVISVLPDPAQCRRPERLGPVHGLPAHPERLARALAARQDLAKARLLLAVGKSRQAAEALVQIVDELAAIEYAPLQLQAELELMIAAPERLPRGVSSLLERAEALGEDRVVARAMLIDRLRSEDPVDETMTAVLAGKVRRSKDALARGLLRCLETREACGEVVGMLGDRHPLSVELTR